MARTDNLTNFLTDVSSAIKTKKGDNTPIKASNFDTEIANLPTGSGGADISEYIDTSTHSVSAGAAIGSGVWTYLVKKLPPITNLNPNSCFFFYGFKGKELDLSQVPSDIEFTDTRSMFQNCTVTNLDLSHLNFDNATAIDGMFQYSGASVLNLGNNSFPKSTSLQYFYSNCSSLKNVPYEKIDYSNKINLTQFLYRCSVLEGEIEINAPVCELVNNGFSYCQKVSAIKFSSNAVKNMASMCSNCTNLITLDLSGVNMSAITGANGSNTMNGFVSSCSKLQNLIFGAGFGSGFATTLSANNNYAAINLSACSSLTKASVLDVFNKVADITGKNTQKITLHANVKALLTDEEIAIATSKNWTVV